MENVRKGNYRFFVSEPDYGKLERKTLLSTFDSNEISKGKYIEKFEKAFSKFIYIDHSVSCCNGTVALHLALKALGIEKGDEVIVPVFGFVAVPNSVMYCNAKPVFCDIEVNSPCIYSAKIKASITKKTKAIIAVHTYGVSCDMQKIMQIAKLYNLYVIEDCSEMLCPEIGKDGHVATFSFFGNKTITTGEGGMVCTNIPHVAEYCRDARNNFHVKDYYHSALGYNYRMSNLQAALGYAQLKRIKELLKKKQKIKELYDKNLSKLFLKQDSGICWIYTVRTKHRDEFRKYMADNGIETRPAFMKSSDFHYFKDNRDYPNSTLWANYAVSLPSSTKLSKSDVLKICKIANAFRLL